MYDGDDFIRLLEEKYSRRDLSWDISELTFRDLSLEVDTKSLIESSHIFSEFEDFEWVDISDIKSAI